MLDSILLVLHEIREGLGVGLSQVAREFPGRVGATGHVNSSTVFRWCTNGCKGASGERVTLEHARIGTRVLTSWPAVERFVAALTVTVGHVPGPRSPQARERAADRAAARLRSMGC